MEEILGVNIHHVLLYPGLSVQSPLQQLRAVRPLGVDRTLTEIWHFRLKGAPEAIYRRALGYYNLVNSPSTLVNADDLWNFWKCHQGLESQGGDWVSFHRNAGQDLETKRRTRSVIGTPSSRCAQFKAWANYHERRERPMSQTKIQGSATEWAEAIDGAPQQRKGRPAQPHVKVSPELKLRDRGASSIVRPRSSTTSAGTSGSPCSPRTAYIGCR